MAGRRLLEDHATRDDGNAAVSNVTPLVWPVVVQETLPKNQRFRHMISRRRLIATGIIYLLLNGRPFLFYDLSV